MRRSLFETNGFPEMDHFHILLQSRHAKKARSDVVVYALGTSNLKFLRRPTVHLPILIPKLLFSAAAARLSGRSPTTVCGIASFGRSHFHSGPLKSAFFPSHARVSRFVSAIRYLGVSKPAFRFAGICQVI